MCSPNAGFICRLLALHDRLQTAGILGRLRVERRGLQQSDLPLFVAGTPPEIARLYRMRPFVDGPIACSVEEDRSLSHSARVLPTAAALDVRTVFVLFGRGGLYIWIGEKAHHE